MRDPPLLAAPLCDYSSFAVRASSCILSAADGSELNATQLDSKKLSNAGVIRCELDFSVSPDKPITAAQLCFETTLVD